MAEIKLIAIDMDGTLLTSDKELTEENRKILFAAAQKGIEIVPTTGRLYRAIPDAVRELPFIHYAILSNGAQVYDVKNDRVIAKTELDWQVAVDIMTYLDPLPLLYDCYIDGKGYMSEHFFPRIEEMVPNVHFKKMYYELRTPVPELKAYLREKQVPLQKMLFATTDPALRQELLDTLEKKFPEILLTTSMPFNGEINHRDAHKGGALRQLADYLALSMENVMAIGDGSNDLTMLSVAGLPVAMENGIDEAKKLAKYITASCDDNGVAKAIQKFCL